MNWLYYFTMVFVMSCIPPSYKGSPECSHSTENIRDTFVSKEEKLACDILKTSCSGSDLNIHSFVAMLSPVFPKGVSEDMVNEAVVDLCHDLVFPIATQQNPVFFGEDAWLASEMGTILNKVFSLHGFSHVCSGPERVDIGAVTILLSDSGCTLVGLSGDELSGFFQNLGEELRSCLSVYQEKGSLICISASRARELSDEAKNKVLVLLEQLCTLLVNRMVGNTDRKDEGNISRCVANQVKSKSGDSLSTVMVDFVVPSMLLRCMSHKFLQESHSHMAVEERRRARERREYKKANDLAEEQWLERQGDMQRFSRRQEQRCYDITRVEKIVDSRASQEGVYISEQSQKNYDQKKDEGAVAPPDIRRRVL